jgi:DNA primase
MIDIQELLNDLNVKYWTHGKNVSKGWLGIKCPFDDCSDKSNHMGISLETGHFSCWKCKRTGDIYDIISVLLNGSYYDAKKLINKHYSPDKLNKNIRMVKRKIEYKDVLPSNSTEELMEDHIEYLLSRKFIPADLKEEYHIRSAGITGKYKFRIIAPVIQDRLIMTFTGMATHGQEPKYKHCSDELSVQSIKSCIYNLDSVRDTIIIAEGITDVWRIGKGSVATFGTKFTDAQINLLIKKKLKRAFVMFDSDAIRLGKDLAFQLTPFIKEVELIELEEGDPADLSINEVENLRKEINI